MNRRGTRLADFCATQLIRGGGILVIGTVIGILFLIVAVALPLWRGIDVTTIRSYPSNQSMVAVDIDEHLQRLRIISRDGQLLDLTGSSGQSLRAEAQIIAHEHFAAGKYTLLWSDNLLTAIDLNAEQPIRYQQQITATGFAAVRIVSGQVRIVRVNNENQLMIDTKPIVDEGNDELDFISGDDQQLPALAYRQPLIDLPTSIDVSNDGTRIVIGTTNGNVMLVKVADDGTVSTIAANVAETAIRAVKFVHGEVSFIVATAKQLSAWQEMPADNLSKLRNFSADGAIIKIAKARRSKLFATIATDGTVQVFALTSGESLRFEHQLPTAQTITFAPRDNALLLTDNQQLHLWSFDVQHPEVTLATLFGKVWYESYQQPSLVWQSSSGTDDFEPKLSLVPLIFGTFKGTLYAMLLVLPLAMAGAVYTNQFASAKFRAVIKPTLEILASLPSVVIGFLAALWLAPFLQSFLLTFFLSLTTVPLLFFGALWARRALQLITKTANEGYEFIVLLPVIVSGFVVAYYLTAPLEQAFFAGDFLSWLYGQAHYDQRNSIVIAFALGFAVIPIVFSLTDDSLSSIPRQLSASSMALGASRWQTIWRVVLPSASPGIFAAAMIGFGRAVGETMIVLMATGNTPIIDASPFNGMRTLAANIAVEVPEAPVNSTLYRTLFLCAVVLFILTFFFNTIAEVVRSQLRERFARF